MTEWQKKNITNEITRKHFRTYDVAQKSTCLLHVRSQQTKKARKKGKKDTRKGEGDFAELKVKNCETNKVQ